MMGTYLDKDADALDGFEFLTMAEAAEVGHWSVLQAVEPEARHAGSEGLIEWALPIQKRHFQAVLAGSKKLAAGEDPNETRSRGARQLAGCRAFTRGSVQQGRRDSNPRPAVLETAALPTELCPCAGYALYRRLSGIPEP